MAHGAFKHLLLSWRGVTPLSWDSRAHQRLYRLSDRSVHAVQMNVERLQKMAGTVRTGGKGTVRR